MGLLFGQPAQKPPSSGDDYSEDNYSEDDEYSEVVDETSKQQDSPHGSQPASTRYA